MLRVYLHTSNIEQHKIAVYERKAHITAEVTESIADFVAHTERAQGFAVVHKGHLRILCVFQIGRAHV